MSEPIKRVSIVVSKGSLEGVYPALIMANGALMEGIEAMLFFTFFGLEAITEKRMDKLKVATVGNPAMHMPTMLGGLPGMFEIKKEDLWSHTSEILTVADFYERSAGSQIIFT